MIVSPFVTPGSVCSTVFDHTSIIKTILLRFCQSTGGVIPDMGRRVNAANHLGSTLMESSPMAAPDLTTLISLAAGWKSQEFHAAFSLQAETRAAPGEANELQEGLRKARKKLIKMGHPPGHP
jgi:phospholipase C